MNGRESDCSAIKWPKEVPLGEHTSLGPKSYCPDYRNLPVTVPKLRSVEQSLQWTRL